MLKKYIFDFDSTLVQVETLETLAAVAFGNRPNKKALLNEIKKITDMGMEGKIDFTESLNRRMALLKCDKGHINQVAGEIKNKITPSVLKNLDFFEKQKDKIFIISGGFKEIIQPIVREWGIAKENIFANTFIFDAGGTVVGVDHKNLLAATGGKAAQARALNLTGEIWAIGDGYTDYEIKKAGAANKFVAFAENISRPNVAVLADHIVKNFDELLRLISLSAYSA